MLKNAIFDVGNVLIEERDSELRKAVRKLTGDEAFSAVWHNLLMGRMSTAECLVNYGYRDKELCQQIREMMQFDNLYHKYLPPRTDVLEVMYDLQEQGYRTFVLSNANDVLRKYMAEYFDITEGVFSCDVGLLKPDFEIYQRLLGRYELDPEETIFFDDKERNVAAAKCLKMKAGIVHESGDIYRAIYPYQPYWV